MPRLPLFSRLRLQTQQAPVRRGPRASATSLLTVARTDAASTCSPRAPCLGYLASHGCANRRSKQVCSPRAPCLGYLASHGCANRRSKHLFAEVPVQKLSANLASERLREQTQQASVRRGPRASATSLLTVALTDAVLNKSVRRGPRASAPNLAWGVQNRGCANRRSKHLFAEGPVPRLPSFSRLRSQTQQAPVRRGPRASAT